MKDAKTIAQEAESRVRDAASHAALNFQVSRVKITGVVRLDTPSKM